MTFTSLLALGHGLLAQAAPGGDAALTQFRDAVYPAILQSFELFGPELRVAVLAIVLLLLDLVLPLRASRHLAWVALLGCLWPLGAIRESFEVSQGLFTGMVATDSFASFFKLFFMAGAVPVILLSYLSKSLEGRRMGEYYFIVFASIFGGMLMASSTHFLMLFLSLEILSVCSYFLVGYVRKDSRGAEAALKYIIYGSVAAAIMGYGLSLWYGLTGSGQLADMAKVLWSTMDPIYTEGAMLDRGAITLMLAFLFVFAGFAYKMSAIPMHFWAPDVYDGAPTAVTAFLSVISKAAGFAIALRFFGSLSSAVTGLPPSDSAAALWAKVDWRMVLIILSMITMTFGNLAALWQTSLKRLMAYSSIAHAGYLMMGLALLGTVGRYGGIQTIAFYLLAYLSMNFGAFAVIILFENHLGTCEMASYKGLGKRAPFLSLSLTVFLFSLIGVPPTAGFMGKFHLIMGVVDQARAPEVAGIPPSWAYYALGLAALLNTAVSAYYYLRIAKTMYFERPDAAGARASRALTVPALGGALVLSMIGLTFYLCFRAEAILDTTLNLRMHV